MSQGEACRELAAKVCYFCRIGEVHRAFGGLSTPRNEESSSE
jgi:hypothetical protein